MPPVLRSVVSLLTGILVLAGLPLVGWGLGDLAHYFADPARLSYIVLAILLQLLVTVWLPSAGANRDKGIGAATLRQRLTVLLAQVIPFALLLMVPACDRRGALVIGDAAIVRIAGLVLFASGFLLMHWSESVLDRQFAMEASSQQDHRLVTIGPYRLLRHPHYLGIILLCLGTSLTFHSWLGVVLVALLIQVLLSRIPEEEAMMGETYGEEWVAYTRQSWRLIPHLY